MTRRTLPVGASLDFPASPTLGGGFGGFGLGGTVQPNTSVPSASLPGGISTGGGSGPSAGQVLAERRGSGSGPIVNGVPTVLPNPNWVPPGQTNTATTAPPPVTAAPVPDTSVPEVEDDSDPMGTILDTVHGGIDILGQILSGGQLSIEDVLAVLRGDSGGGDGGGGGFEEDVPPQQDTSQTGGVINQPGGNGEVNETNDFPVPLPGNGGGGQPEAEPTQVPVPGPTPPPGGGGDEDSGGQGLPDVLEDIITGGGVAILDDIGKIFSGGGGGAGGSASSTIGDIFNSIAFNLDQDAQLEAVREAIEAGKFNPFNVNVGGQGTARFDTANNEVTVDTNQTFQDLINKFRGDSLRNLQDPRVGQAQDRAFNFGGNKQDIAQQDAFDTDSFKPSTNVFGSRINSVFNQGQDIADTQQSTATGLLDQNFDEVAAERLGLLREQARPFEEQAASKLGNRLFGTGRLGTTGGGLDLEAFGRGLGQADTGRQIASMDFADKLTGRDQQLAAQLFGQAGTQTGRLADVAGSGRSGTASGITAENSRGADRLRTIQDIFGFGNKVESGRIANSTATNKNLLDMLTSQRNLIALGGNIGGTQAAAGAANAGNITAGGKFGTDLSTMLQTIGSLF